MLALALSVVKRLISLTQKNFLREAVTPEITTFPRDLCARTVMLTYRFEHLTFFQKQKGRRVTYGL